MFKILSTLFVIISLMNRPVQADTVTYIHTDMLGTPVAATDESGNVIWREQYTPFGKKLVNSSESQSNNVGFTGHQFDSDTGLTYMQARYYDPVIGRFYSNDPVGYLGHVDEGNPIHGFNRYAYVNNNPYKYTDPTGELGIAIKGLQAMDKAHKVYKSNKRIQKVLKNKQSTGKKGEHTSQNGGKEADKDFKTLTKGNDVKIYENGTKVGKTPDGRTVDKHGSGGKSGKGADVKKGTDSIKIKNEGGKRTQTTVRYPEDKT